MTGQSGLVHRLREPTGEPAGALILNHGRGADEHDLYPLLDALDPGRRLLGVTTGAPLTNPAPQQRRGSASLRSASQVPPGGRHWYLVQRVGFPDPATFAASYELLTSFADGLLADRGISWDRVALGGFSMGTVMSYALALGPGRPAPAALLAYSGFVPAVEGWSPELAGREAMRTFIHHGANDPVIPVEFARRARELLTGAGLEVDYLETDAGHWIPPEAVPPARELVNAIT